MRGTNRGAGGLRPAHGVACRTRTAGGKQGSAWKSEKGCLLGRLKRAKGVLVAQQNGGNAFEVGAHIRWLARIATSTRRNIVAHALRGSGARQLAAYARVLKRGLEVWPAGRGGHAARAVGRGGEASSLGALGLNWRHLALRTPPGWHAAGGAEDFRTRCAGA